MKLLGAINVIMVVGLYITMRIKMPNKIKFFHDETKKIHEFDNFEDFIKWTVSSELARFVLVPPRGYNGWACHRNDEDYWYIRTWPGYD